jgi:hypothetical protein
LYDNICPDRFIFGSPGNSGYHGYETISEKTIFLIRMNLLVRCGLISGAICGEAMVLLVLVNTILIRHFSDAGAGQTGSSDLYLWGVAYPLLVILIFEAGGLFSSWLCRGEKQTPAVSLIPGFVTGVTVAIILEIMWISNLDRKSVV